MVERRLKFMPIKYEWVVSEKCGLPLSQKPGCKDSRSPFPSALSSADEGGGLGDKAADSQNE